MTASERNALEVGHNSADGEWIAGIRLRRLPAEGPRPVTRWLEIYAEHAGIHASQVCQNRAGWAARHR